LSTTTEHLQPVRQRLALSYSRIFTPALVLAVVVVLSGIRAGLDWVGVILLLVGIAVVPGLIYKRSKGLFLRLGLPDRWRTCLVTVLLLAGVVVCYLIPVPQPVPSTVSALFAGNVLLLFFRRWLNVSAHVSVLTLAVLWVAANYGNAWAWLLLLSPMMLFSRVSLREHSWQESLSGALLGLAVFCWFLITKTWS
jgi:hypothetical protein